MAKLYTASDKIRNRLSYPRSVVREEGPRKLSTNRKAPMIAFGGSEASPNEKRSQFEFVRGSVCVVYFLGRLKNVSGTEKENGAINIGACKYFVIGPSDLALMTYVLPWSLKLIRFVLDSCEMSSELIYSDCYWTML